MNGEPSTRTARPYRSTRRAQAAADTRAAILDAALRLFVERGYGRVTVGDIARAAATAVPTVYASAGGKAAILATLVNQAMRDPIVDDTLTEIRKSRVPHEVIRLTAHGTRLDNERYHDMIQVMVTAAAVDETATATLVRSNRVYRQALAQSAHQLQELHALRRGLTVERATDILWFYFGHQAWHLFVSERQWSWDDTEQWLAGQASTALVRARPR